MGTGLLAFTVALIVSMSVTIPVRQLALRVGMVDQPSPRKVHLRPVPLLGGLAIYSGVLLALVVSFGGAAFTQVLGILTGATLVILVGTLDDRGLLHHQVKLFVAMPIAGLILLAAGIHAQFFSVLFTGRAAAIADDALTIFWVTGVTASFSIFDYMDGLCGGIAAIASFFFATLAILNGQIFVSTLAAALMGAALGFLRWNFNPAKIFMGDGGAMFLGFMMATLALKLRLNASSHAADWLVPIFLLAIPLFDTTLVSISRSRRGLLPFTTPGKDHTGHRLANCGLGTRYSVLLLYLFATVFGVLGVAASRMSTTHASELGAAAAVAALIGVTLLERAPYERQGRKLSKVPFTE